MQACVPNMDLVVPRGRMSFFFSRSGFNLFFIKRKGVLFEKITKAIYDGGEGPSKAKRQSLATEVKRVYYI
jgi:hypothetical protein